MAVPGELVDPEAVRSQWTTLVGDPTVRAYLARPAEGGDHPALVLIHEAFGLVPHIEDVARRFAGAGFVTIAPDLYSRVGAPDPQDRAEVSRKVLGLRDEDCVRDLEASAEHVRGLAGSTGRVGAVGFCSGGRNALLLACRSDAVHAAVDCWGGFVGRASPEHEVTPERPVPPLAEVDRLRCPLLAVFGAEDSEPSPALAGEMRDRAAASGRDVTARVFTGAGHAFFADYRPTYVQEAAFQLWPVMLDFLRCHLT